jgi:hypothetical protein
MEPPEKPGRFSLELAHALEVRHTDARVLRSPGVIRRRADAVLAYQLRHRHSGIAFLQDRYDLGIRKPRLLHYPSRDDTADFVAALRERSVTPHVAANDRRQGGSALDGRTTRHAGYRASQRLRKRVEEIFGWGKDGRPMRKMKVAGLAKVSFLANLTVGCCALLRVARLTAPPPLVSA